MLLYEIRYKRQAKRRIQASNRKIKNEKRRLRTAKRKMKNDAFKRLKEKKTF